MKLTSLESDFQSVVQQLLMGSEIATGLKWIAYSCRRTMAEQKVIYEQDKNGKDDDGDGKIDESDEHVTNAPPGYSAHNYGLAVDCAPMIGNSIWWNAPDKVWKAYADIAVKLGMVAGYYFKSIHDAPHVEHPRWRDQQKLWKAGKVKLP